MNSVSIVLSKLNSSHQLASNTEDKVQFLCHSRCFACFFPVSKFISNKSTTNWQVVITIHTYSTARQEIFLCHSYNVVHFSFLSYSVSWAGESLVLSRKASHTKGSDNIYSCIITKTTYLEMKTNVTRWVLGECRPLSRQNAFSRNVNQSEK